jgi:hypothetical protein
MEITKHGSLDWQCREHSPTFYSRIPFVALYECYNCGHKMVILETINTDDLGYIASNTGFTSVHPCPNCEDDMKTIKPEIPVLVLCEQVDIKKCLLKS